MWEKIEKRDGGRSGAVEMGLCYISMKEPKYLYSQNRFVSQTQAYLV